MAIAARFGLELKQYDTVNAFVNAILPNPTYMRMPPGYKIPGKNLSAKRGLIWLTSVATVVATNVGKNVSWSGFRACST